MYARNATNDQFERVCPVPMMRCWFYVCFVHYLEYEVIFDNMVTTGLPSQQSTSCSRLMIFICVFSSGMLIVWVVFCDLSAGYHSIVNLVIALVRT